MSVIRTYGGKIIPEQHRPLVFQAPFIAVLGAMSFNMGLCFINTHVGGIGTTYAIACEITIISAVLFYTLPMVDQTRLFVISGVVLYLVSLAALRVVFSGNALEIKPVRDFLIPIAFFLLGERSGDVKAADKIVLVALVLVVVVGLFEFVFPDTFTRVFNIAGFYVERGTMAAGQVQDSSNLFVSGMRPQGGSDGGRNLLPFLGDHRMSSIFLEPVSAGNFGIIVFMWGLVRSLSTRKIYWGMFMSAMLIIILSDSRFGAYFCIISLLLALCPSAIRKAITCLLPIFGILSLVFLLDTFSTHYGLGNGVIRRAMMSGEILGRYGLLNWFGLDTPDYSTFDSGYANVIGGVGIIGLIVFWTLLLSLKGRGDKFELFRSLVSAYFALLFCISNSPLTIKTGSILWFMLGVLSCRGSEKAESTRIKRLMG
jgi:putative polymerase